MAAQTGDPQRAQTACVGFLIRVCWLTLSRLFYDDGLLGCDAVYIGTQYTRSEPAVDGVT